MVDQIEKNQRPDGYFNSYFISVEPSKRFCDRTMHELYCAGHLIEAAIAYRHATGRDRFLKLMCRYADEIERIFVREHSARFVTPGHEEIELALVKLYHATGERRYLDLAKFFIDHRGEDAAENYYDFANSLYAQDDRPVREFDTATGHAVRAVYLYCAMADLAREYNDEGLWQACQRVFDSIVNRRMYITGGIGSTHHGEAFTEDYDLPNQTAYAETCAALGLVLFAARMSANEPKAVYADVAERALYNGFLSGVSLDGKAFFYENPLAIDPVQRRLDTSMAQPARRLPAMQRAEVFECSCCPPNVARLIASVGDLLYSYDDNTVYLHHYMPSETHFQHQGRDITIIQKTDYPCDGKLEIIVRGKLEGQIAVRIPGWCRSFHADQAYELRDGYAYFSAYSYLNVIFDMPPAFMEAAPMVQNDCGRICVMRGPLVYCMEGVDNGSCLRDIRLLENAEFSTAYSEALGANVLKTTGVRRAADKFNGLYRPYQGDEVEQEVTLIPYYAFANRGISEMLVWIGLK